MVLVEIEYLAIADANVVLKFFDTIFVELIAYFFSVTVTISVSVR